jgi:hypothetical protein
MLLLVDAGCFAAGSIEVLRGRSIVAAAIRTVSKRGFKH